MTDVMTTDPGNNDDPKRQRGDANGGPVVQNADPLPDGVAKDLVQLFKLLSDETRLRIIFFLMQTKEINVRTLCELLGQSQPAVSHHLALLRVAGLIESRRDGKHNFYRILPQRFEQQLKTLFDAAPRNDDRFRFKDYELSYTPVDGD